MYSFNEYKFVRFEKGSGYHKYKAILKNRTTGREVSVSFGDRRYEQYQDKTNLKLWKHLDHKDPQRRKAYRQRHAGDNLSEFSAGYFSWRFLW
jgi:hypothetical protein